VLDFIKNLKFPKNDKEFYELYIQTGYKQYYTNINNEKTAHIIPINGMSLRIMDYQTQKFIYSHTISENEFNYLNHTLKSIERSVFLKPKTSTKKLKIELNGKKKQLLSYVNELLLNNNLKHNSTYLLIDDYKTYAINNNNKYVSSENNIYFSVEYEINSLIYKFRYIMNEFDDYVLLEKFQKAIHKEIENSKLINTLQTDKYDLIMASGQPAILFHECCGHLCEINKVINRKSPFFNKINNRVGSDCLTIIDDKFKLKKSSNLDDEGNIKQKVNLIKDGILENYLTDYWSSKTLNYINTGNSRRECFEQYPESRMFCTYIENGYSSFNNMISNTKKGIYIKKLSDSYINHKNGNMISSIDEGYLIENGKIINPIYGCNIAERFSSILTNIDEIGNDLSFDSIMCSSDSGNIYVEIGQPTIKVKNIQVYQ